MAMFSCVNTKLAMQSSYFSTGRGKLIVRGKNVTFKPGFVHVLPSDSFIDFKGEFISYEPVRAVGILRVTPEIIKLLPDIKVCFPH